MLEPVFQDIPNVELLQWLARGSLKQNLQRAVRLWVWLSSLYGENRLALNDAFTYAQWRDVFFTSTHPKGETVPKLHDENCPCAKTTAQWLFDPKIGISEIEWKKSVVFHAGINKSQLDELLKARLFGVTRRSLQADLETLAELGWLVYKNQKYDRVTELPLRPTTINNEVNIAKLGAYELNFLEEDLSAIAENHSQKINGVQRFFLKLDYVIPRSTIDLVEDWQYKLRQLWTKTPVPPIKLTYNSAKVRDTVGCIVYPVCIYYMQRAVYLCAYGESPLRQGDWYNFRLDRIQNMIPLDWTNPQLPHILLQRYQQTSLPTPDDIAVAMSKAWGFDFYLPAQLMLLRFEREFHDRYVKGTERHDTFAKITYQQAQHLIRREVQQAEPQRALLKILANRSPNDAYYQVSIRYQDHKYRDNNVIMRLRAWRPKCEVLLPFDLRQSIAAEVAKEFLFYHQNSLL
ncbi:MULTISPECIES: TIGR03985 family CRISPR-associated protein [Fischerella]|uniref:TIGR03985 family CRISPR-associated protein n=1 Tax=Fischerella muscicola CCMEE 5323 TaxID=2019572 RepID=A0A2N6K1N2_FISMU|nr:TIGR03985 family CRISPR-associated protein [Fischerella muscicola]MBD2433785.1 TIGR03985 family CRISPR-associated protein [Fischerella sp. FACHB-380]PLZ88502.1 TIGR03985 family CRISPR-associated protein [Fischerella muscicola CCMEE 5323]